MPRLRVEDPEPEPELWLACRACRAQAIARLIAGTEQVLLNGLGTGARKRWAALRADAIEFAAFSTAFTAPLSSQLLTGQSPHECKTGKVRKRYGMENHGEEDS